MNPKTGKFAIIPVVLLAFLFSGGVAFVTRGNDEHHNNGEEDGGTKFIDLTHAFNNETAVWPGRKITFFTEWERRDSNGVWSASYGFCTSEHTSTHLDAPYHFNEQGRRLHEIPFEDLIDVPGVMIDIYDKVHVFKNGKLKVNDNYGLTREDVLEWEEKNGVIPQGSVVLLRTGWDSRWGNATLFLGEKKGSDLQHDKREDESSKDDNSAEDDNEIGADVHLERKGAVSKQLYDPSESWLSTELSFPAYDASAAKFLAVERAVRGVGVDVISIDPGNKNVMSPAHVTFASRNIYMLEMVANLHQLPPRGFNLWLVPFKIDRGTAAPTRVVARLNE